MAVSNLRHALGKLEAPASPRTPSLAPRGIIPQGKNTGKKLWPPPVVSTAPRPTRATALLASFNAQLIQNAQFVQAYDDEKAARAQSQAKLAGNDEKDTFRARSRRRMTLAPRVNTAQANGQSNGADERETTTSESNA
jgi:hypothetical protein